MELDEIITDHLRTRIASAIADAERNTGAEIRVHIEDECPEDVMDRAAYLFAELGMHRTRLRNGVLIYAALIQRKLAIIGDVGISSKVPHDFWAQTRDGMIVNFAEGKYEEGFVGAIAQAGQMLGKLYPLEQSDRNELSNAVSTHQRKRS
ncbi:MAG: TPM domain-containing protein [Flavobacteriales bacterium]|nr:TPM domain-containing protein [Flavobacteriales bacterium]